MTFYLITDIVVLMKTNRMHAAIRTTIVNSVTNTLLAIFKIIIGFIGHSQTLIADGIHSFSDLLIDFLVLIAAKLGDVKPDEGHPYGHRRIETIGGLIIALVLIAVAAGIAYAAIEKIVLNTPTELPTWPVLVVAIVSIIANEGLYRYTLFEADRAHSDLIRTNALHNRSDVLTSIIVLFAVAGAMFGIHYFDSIGAIIVALLILRMGLQLIWGATQELIDASADPQTLEAITQYILTIPGVLAVHQLRTRSHGGNIFVDLHIQVPPNISVSEGHYISETVHISLIKKFREITDVTVHIDPEDDEENIPSKHLPPRIKVEADLRSAWKNLDYYGQIQKINLHYLDGKLTVDVILPITILDTIAKETVQQQIGSAAQSIPNLNKIEIFYV